MSPALLEDLAADGFGHWLAGFVDGEGTFNISYLPKQDTYQCRFAVFVRADDQPVLEECCRRTTLGRVNAHARLDNPRANPQAYWRVLTRTECLALVEIFDAFPLRAKKARDYAVWRDAVVEWSERLGRGNVGHLPWLKQELEAVRKYRELIPG